ncbi:MAG TPA: hypothetical protein VMH23_11705, partial [Bacteroidota bacterium]|nr:hypothetical protein [Bacteroidota bacterium]
MRFKRRLVSLVGVAAVCFGQAFAQTIVVTSLDDSGPGTLRNAVASAGDGATITFDPSLHGQLILRSRITVSKNLSIYGPASGGVKIYGYNYFHPPNSAGLFGIDTLCNVTLRNLTMIGGSGSEEPGGGGILNRGALLLDTCEISD